MSDRKKRILQIVVDEYINSAVPVSSKAITEKHLTDVSSATVRNELASLEELGYLTQFHTSGGRVPSPQAYRFCPSPAPSGASVMIRPKKQRLLALFLYFKV